VLDVTSGAARGIRELVAIRNSTPGAGFRISALNDRSGDFYLSVASCPQEHDQVVSVEGVDVFLDATATDALRDKVLDVEINPQGVAFFYLVDRSAW
jgi:Fe-S cluster assembly iron-binding protein IscA